MAQFGAPRGGPAICRPTGNLPAVKPQGIEMVGRPNGLKGAQFEADSGSRGTLTRSRFKASSIVRGMIRIVGRTTRSKFVNAASMFLRRRASFHCEST